LQVQAIMCNCRLLSLSLSGLKAYVISRRNPHQYHELQEKGAYNFRLLCVVSTRDLLWKAHTLQIIMKTIDCLDSIQIFNQCLIWFYKTVTAYLLCGEFIL